MRLEVEEEEDLSEACRRDCFCAMCMIAFCSHCCRCHHHMKLAGCNCVLYVDTDAAGRPVFPKRYPNGELIEDFMLERLVAQDYVTTLNMDAYCTKCTHAFCTGICSHHHQYCGRDAIVRRIEEHGGRHYVRCKGDEKWFAELETVLGDPVGEDYGDLMLLPLLRRRQGACAQCGGPVPRPVWSRCSPACAAKHDQEVAQRRERRGARRAARQMGRHVDG